jgi:hypothetical protein
MNNMDWILLGLAQTVEHSINEHHKNDSPAALIENLEMAHFHIKAARRILTKLRAH